MVQNEVHTYEAEKHTSQGTQLNEAEKTAMRINEARKQGWYSTSGCRTSGGNSTSCGDSVDSDDFLSGFFSSSLASV